MVIDADEVIAQQDYETLRQITNTPPLQPTAYQILTRNYINRNDIVGWQANDGSYTTEECGCGWIPSIKTRLWSNHANIKFSYPVHEVVTPSLEENSITTIPCPIVIHHYGKLNQLQADKKGEKYFELGLRKLEEMSNAAPPLRELAIQAGILGRSTEAATLWQRFLKIEADNAEAHLNLGTALFNLGKFKDALKAAEKSSRLNPELKESYFNRALYELHLGRPAAAVKKLNKLLKQTPEYSAAKFLYATALCCKNGIKAGCRAFHDIRNEVLTFEMIKIAGNELADTLKKAGRKKDAEKLKKAILKLKD